MEAKIPVVKTVGELKAILEMFSNDTKITVFELRYCGYDEYYEDDLVVSESADGELLLTPAINASIVNGLVLDPKDWEVLG